MRAEKGRILGGIQAEARSCPSGNCWFLLLPALSLDSAFPGPVSDLLSSQGPSSWGWSRRISGCGSGQS